MVNNAIQKVRARYTNTVEDMVGTISDFVIVKFRLENKKTFDMVTDTICYLNV